MAGKDAAEPSWRELAAELRARGLARRADDTRATMAARLREAALADPRAGTPARLVPAVVGPAETLDELAPLVARFGGRRVAREAAVLPPGRAPAFKRAVRRWAPHLAATEQPGAWSSDVEAALWAAARFVLSLQETLGWPAALAPTELELVQAPTDPAAERRANALVRLWTAALDARLDPLAEVQPELARPRAPVPLAPFQAILRQALAESRCVLLVYQGATRAAVTRRTVEPQALEQRHGQEYLRAFCHWRQQERLFRLDRVLSAELLEERFGEPGGGE